MKWKQWRVALLDLDGTLYRGNQPIEGASEFTERLRQRGIQPAFVTNNSMRTPDEVMAKLAEFHIRVQIDEVFTSSQMAAAFIRTQVGQGAGVAALGRSGLEEALRGEGLEPVLARNLQPLDNLSGDIRAVVAGLDIEVTYAHLAWICDAIMRVGRWVLTNGDVRLPHGNGFLPGSGAIGRLIETATGIKPEVVGKPNPAYMDFVLRKLGVRKEQAVVIGDNLATDILAANRAGIESIFVRSGVTYNEKELVHPDNVLGQSTYAASSVADLLVD